MVYWLDIGLNGLFGFIVLCLFNVYLRKISMFETKNEKKYFTRVCDRVMFNKLFTSVTKDKRAKLQNHQLRKYLGVLFAKIDVFNCHMKNHE